MRLKCLTEQHYTQGEAIKEQLNSRNSLLEGVLRTQGDGITAVIIIASRETACLQFDSVIICRRHQVVS